MRSGNLPCLVLNVVVCCVRKREEKRSSQEGPQPRIDLKRISYSLVIAPRDTIIASSFKESNAHSNELAHRVPILDNKSCRNRLKKTVSGDDDRSFAFRFNLPERSINLSLQEMAV